MDDNPDRNARARRIRSYAIALILGGIVILFFLMTVVRLGIRFG